MNNFRFTFFLSCLLLVSLNLGALAESNEVKDDGKIVSEIVISGQDGDGVPLECPLSVRTRLIDRLFTSYSRNLIPDNVTLNLGVALTKINIDEEHQLVRADSWLRAKWNDNRLKWDPSEFGGLKVFRFPSNQIWLPDVSLYNTADSEHNIRCRETNVLIFNTGHIIWVPSCQFDALCSQMTLHETPYAEQNCTVTFGSWVFDGTLMDLQPEGEFGDKDKLDLQHLIRNKNWEVKESPMRREVKYYSCCKEPYITIHYDLIFQRTPNSYANCH